MVDIVLVNWNSGEFLTTCLASGILEFENVGSVIVVDNNSSDNSLELFSRLLTNSKLKVFKLDENIGFSRACNFGASKGSSEYILFLNTDTIIKEESIFKCEQFLNIHFNYGACSVQVVDEFYNVVKSCSRFSTPIRMLFDSTLLSRVLPFQSFGCLMRDFSHLNSRDVQQVIGAFLFIRRSVFRILEGFDERFFVYYEDMDLCHRIIRNGYKIRFLSDSNIIHFGGKSSDFDKYFSRKKNIESRHKYMKKYFGNFGNYFSVFVELFFDRPLDFFLRGIKRSKS